MCGGRLQARGGVQHLYSHVKYGDQDYGNGADCDWVIEAEGLSGFVRLQFVSFELEGKYPLFSELLILYCQRDNSLIA